jgi:hypothetical protein
MSFGEKKITALTHIGGATTIILQESLSIFCVTFTIRHNGGSIRKSSTETREASPD